MLLWWLDLVWGVCLVGILVVVLVGLALVSLCVCVCEGVVCGDVAWKVVEVGVGSECGVMVEVGV